MHIGPDTHGSRPGPGDAALKLRVRGSDRSSRENGWWIVSRTAYDCDQSMVDHRAARVPVFAVGVKPATLERLRGVPGPCIVDAAGRPNPLDEMDQSTQTGPGGTDKRRRPKARFYRQAES